MRGRLRLRRHPGGGYPRHEQLLVHPRKLRRRRHRRSLGERGIAAAYALGSNAAASAAAWLTLLSAAVGVTTVGLAAAAAAAAAGPPFAPAQTPPAAWLERPQRRRRLRRRGSHISPMALSSPLMRGDLRNTPGPMVGVPGVSPSESDAAASSRPRPPELTRAALSPAASPSRAPPDPDPDPSCESSPDASPSRTPSSSRPSDSPGDARTLPMRRCAFELGSWMSVSRCDGVSVASRPLPVVQREDDVVELSPVRERKEGKKRSKRSDEDRREEEVAVDDEDEGTPRRDLSGYSGGTGGIGRGKRAHLRYGHLVMPCSRHRCLRTVTHRPSCGDGCGDGGVGWVGSGVARRAPGRVFSTRGGRSRGPHGPSRTHLARDVVDGEVEVGAQHLERDALDQPHPRFCDGMRG